MAELVGHESCRLAAGSIRSETKPYPGSIGVHGCAKRERLNGLHEIDPLSAIASPMPRLWSCLPLYLSLLSLAMKQAH